VAAFQQRIDWDAAFREFEAEEAKLLDEEEAKVLGDQRPSPEAGRDSDSEPNGQDRVREEATANDSRIDQVTSNLREASVGPAEPAASGRARSSAGPRMEPLVVSVDLDGQVLERPASAEQQFQGQEVSRADAAQPEAAPGQDRRVSVPELSEADQSAQVGTGNLGAQDTGAVQRISTTEELTDILRRYFDARSITPVEDPWSRIIDGFLIQVHVKRWPGFVSLGAQDFGLPEEDFKRLENNIQWARLNLLTPEVRGVCESAANSMRELTKRYGRRVHWGEFVPLTALDRFKAEWLEYRARWEKALDWWQANYDDARKWAIDQVAYLASKTWLRINNLPTWVLDESQEDWPVSYEARRFIDPWCQKNVDENVVGNLDRSQEVIIERHDTYVDSMVQRIMREYPPREDIRKRFSVDYDMSYIPTPTFQVEQAAYAEQLQLERDAALARQKFEIEQDQLLQEAEKLALISELSEQQLKQEAKLKAVREYNQKLRTELEQKKSQILDTFYRGYALDVRQRFHESLQYLIEGVNKGRFTPGASRSVRAMLTQVEAIMFEDDEEVQEMVAKCNALLEQDDFTPEQIAQDLDDLSLLLRTSIMAMGDRPRVPARMQGELKAELLPGELDAATAPQFAEKIRTARVRAGLSSSLAETLIIEANLGPQDLRRRVAENRKLE
jgi:hypothetical protein